MYVVCEAARPFRHLPAWLTSFNRHADQDPTSRKDLFFQRRKLGLLPPTSDQLPQVNQVPTIGQGAVLG